MALSFADRVKETSTTTGTGTYDLAGAASGYQTFVAGVGTGATVPYVVEDGTDWEHGIGTVTDASPDTLSRDLILTSSNSNAAVNWAAGTRNVFLGVGARTFRTPRNYVAGLELVQLSAAQVRVKAGECRDRSQRVDLSLASDTTCDFATTGAVNGTDEFTSGATISTTSGSRNATASQSILTEVGVKTHATITFSTSTTTLTASADVRGFLAVRDLVGHTTTVGFARVTAIDSAGMSVTLSVALPGGDASAGTALKVIENPTCKAGTQAANYFRSIAANGTTLVFENTASSTASGQALKIGVELASTFYAVHVISGTTGTGTCFSTQRTTPFAITGYSTFNRRIGWVLQDTSSDIYSFTQGSFGTARRMTYEIAQATSAMRITSDGLGATTTWKKQAGGAVVPPTCVFVYAYAQRSGGSNMNVFFRFPGAGVATTTRSNTVFFSADGVGFFVEVPCDLAGNIECSQNVGTTGVYIDVDGYLDDLSIL